MTDVAVDWLSLVAENRVATATKNGATTTYTYDADGNRVEK
jgi:YD repeat-containing protein